MRNEQSAFLSAWALEGIGEVTQGDDIAQLILDALKTDVLNGDIFVITSKIVSKAEGRIVRAENRESAIQSETLRVLASRIGPDGHVTQIVENRFGLISAAAGVDASNTPAGTVLLLPVNPDESAKKIAQKLRASLGIDVGVIISDTLGRAWRLGQTDSAIGAAGVKVIDDLRGTTDAEGRKLLVTAPCVADEISSAADLVKGKTSRLPVAIVRGRPDLVGSLDLGGASTIIRPQNEDLFSMGTKESYQQGYEDALKVTKTDSAAESHE